MFFYFRKIQISLDENELTEFLSRGRKENNLENEFRLGGYSFEKLGNEKNLSEGVRK